MKQPREKGAFLRRCSGCGKQAHKSDLLRVAKLSDGSVSVDTTGKAEGRGAYVCKSPACVKAAIKNGRVAKTLKTKVPAEIYDRLTALTEAENE